MRRTNKVPEAAFNWREEAACRGFGIESDLFFPVGTTGPAVEQIILAKSICGTCISRLACLDYALENNEQHGIWGGKTEEERRSILKKRRSAS